MRLLGNRVAIVEIPKGERKSPNGKLFLAETEIEPLLRAKIFAIGSEVSKTLDLHCGDMVYATIYDSEPIIEVDGKKIRIYDADKILAKIS